MDLDLDLTIINILTHPISRYQLPLIKYLPTDDVEPWPPSIYATSWSREWAT
jgi:hypothetical protein